MPGLLQPEPALRVQLRRGHAIIPAEPSLGGDQIEASCDIESIAERLGQSAHFTTESAEHPLHLALFRRFECHPFGMECRHRGRLDEDRLSRSTHPMHDPCDFMAVIHGNRQDMMISMHCGIRITQQAAQLRVAQHAADFPFDPFFEFMQSAANIRQFWTGHVQHMPARIDAGRDQPRRGTKIFDPR